MTAARELAIGDRIAGKYRIERVLGRGGMGAVYLATNEDIGRKVAIKVLLPQLADDVELLRRFRQEARTAAAIGHPGIVDVLDLGTTDDGAPFIVMEALEGETLGARLARERRLSVADAVSVVAVALDALAAAHAKGILHRDLKPDNLFLVARPVPGLKILDFGISKLAGEGEDVSLTHTGVVFGTPLYMSAEQAKGAKHVTAASDVYAMGAILYQLLTGRTPFIGSSYNELISNVLTASFPRLRELRADVPVALATLIERMLARDPSERPQSAGEARSELLAIPLPASPPPDATADTLAPAIADTAAPGATVASLPPRRAASSPSILSQPPPRARSHMPWLVVGLAVIAVALAAFAFTRTHASAPPPADAAAHVPMVVVDAPLPAPDASVVAPADAAPPPVDATTVHHAPPAVHDAAVPAASPIDARRSAIDIDHDNPFH